MSKLLKFAYPYWVISRVVVLVLASLVFLILYEFIRYSQVLKLSTKRRLNYVNRAN